MLNGSFYICAAAAHNHHHHCVSELKEYVEGPFRIFYWASINEGSEWDEGSGERGSDSRPENFLLTFPLSF